MYHDAIYLTLLMISGQHNNMQLQAPQNNYSNVYSMKLYIVYFAINTVIVIEVSKCLERAGGQASYADIAQTRNVHNGCLLDVAVVLRGRSRRKGKYVEIVNFIHNMF